LVDAVLLGETGGEVGRDQLAKLGEDGQLRPSWFVINHPGDPEWDRPPATLKKSRSMGWLCTFFIKNKISKFATGTHSLDLLRWIQSADID